jgi:SIR2-like domain
MARFTIVIGNGLGMAIDKEYFKLQNGLKTVWSDTSNFSQEQKNLVISTISGLSSEDYPSSEEQLDTLQVAVVATEFLKSLEAVEAVKVERLSKQSRELPRAFRRFVHEVAAYFDKSGESLPDKFISRFAQFINETKSHVATLNYDSLLYNALSNFKVLDGYNGSLIDGFWKTGFAKTNLDRYPESRFGWYFHLHGSPLYIGNKKLMREGRQELKPTEQSHIVLTYFKHKPIIIASSSILTEYWKKFDIALSEAEKIVLFGYSGRDEHLNERICLHGQGKPVHVIEWKGDRDRNSGHKYWNEKLKGHKITINQLDHILDFDGWKDL